MVADTNPITTLRLKRARSRKAKLMPVSAKPRYNAVQLTRGPNPYSLAGTLVYGWLEYRAARSGPTMEEVARRQRTSTPRSRRRPWARSQFAPADVAGSRPAERRRRQKLVQHPSVVARFANHPTRAQIEEAIAS